MSATQPNPSVLPFPQARSIVETYAEQHQEAWRARSTEKLPLIESVSRVLAQDIVADRDLPPFPRSTRDGFAVRASDVSEVPVELEVVGELRAGESASKISTPVQPRQAVEIMTGAPVPEGLDAIVMVEYTNAVASGNHRHVRINRRVESGENVVPRGSEARAGQPLALTGRSVDHAVIAAAASAGLSALTVYSRPQVAIISTGDEIVAVDSRPEPHQIRNSNSYSLAAQVLSCGATPRILPIAPDDPERLEKIIADALSSDLVLLSGGVSMGKYDFVEQVLAKFNANVFFTGALIQPGKPIVFLDAVRPGSTHRVPVFGLPGNPVSTMVTFDLFARPLIQAISGATAQPLRFLRAKLAKDIRTKTGLTRFLPAQLSGNGTDVTVELVQWQGSGDVVSVARSNCYIVVEPERETITAGEMVPVFLRGLNI